MHIARLNPKLVRGDATFPGSAPWRAALDGRPDRVEDLRRRVESGTYQVSPRQIAQRFLDRLEGTRI
ncbi:MAG TPA: flagellar biosynthesis anti-sigma factor FlgM [Dehalococcoidia bacterium]|nr:flagellar biosynthesis anti-sigma factor FlgM [Dehalococcoidia bacterium]